MIFAVSASEGVPIDLTDATPTVTGATTLHIEGIATLGSTYWADFQWNAKTNKFDVSAYGLEVPEGFVRVEPGTFNMGSPEDEPGRSSSEARHEVTLTQGFFLAETEVTQAEWVSVMGDNPSHYAGCEDCPVENVTWKDAVDYCNRLSAQDGLEPAYRVDGEDVMWDEAKDGYRLPTEAEWEYACRAGSSTPFYSGEITNFLCYPLDSNLDQIGWYCGNTSPAGTRSVGQESPNAWGLYDTNGNVWEWGWDWYGDYPPGPAIDPRGPEAGSTRCLRGGGWLAQARNCRSASRGRADPDFYHQSYGFRLTRSAP